jgi:hypothetical protein
MNGGLNFLHPSHMPPATKEIGKDRQSVRTNSERSGVI